MAARAEDLLSELKKLLALETEAEKQSFLRRLAEQTPQERERGGGCLYGLSIEDEYTGLGGRFILVLGKSSRAALPYTQMDAGTPVLFAATQGKDTWSCRAVVSQRDSKVIHIAMDEPLPELDAAAILQVDIAFDESTRKKERDALQQVMSAKGNRLASLRDCLLGKIPPKFQSLMEATTRHSALNPTQQAAVNWALTAQDVAIIHGPPGTGKTTTLVEIIYQAVQIPKKVLVTAPSNLGVDNLLEKLVARGLKPIRLGHPARVMESLRAWSLDFVVEKHEDARLAQKMMKQASVLFQQARRYTRAAPAKGEKPALWAEAKALMADARQLESRAVKRVLDDADIICATTTGLDPFLLGNRSFDLVVLDEAGQATEPNAWIPLLRGTSLICGGDHCQLPPTVLSREAAEQGLGISLMERLVQLYGPLVTRRLDIQYRMHESIMNFSSQEFYEGALQAAPAVAQHRLRDILPALGAQDDLGPLLFIDTAGSGFQEETERDSGSRFNLGEAKIVERRIANLLALGLAAEQIAVITPYAAQARLLRDRLAGQGIEVDTIDGFQGREKEAVVISLVRSNDDQEIGFLKENRRLNVALTRARRHMLVIGDSATLGSHGFFQRLLQYFESQQSYHSVFEIEAELMS